MSVYIISFWIIHIFSAREKKIGEYIDNQIQAYIYTACDFDSSLFWIFLFLKIRHFYQFIFSENNIKCMLYLREVASSCNECGPVTTCLCPKYILKKL